MMIIQSCYVSPMIYLNEIGTSKWQWKSAQKQNKNEIGKINKNCIHIYIRCTLSCVYATTKKDNEEVRMNEYERTCIWSKYRNDYAFHTLMRFPRFLFFIVADQKQMSPSQTREFVACFHIMHIPTYIYALTYF